jgi:hypothetical protein
LLKNIVFGGMFIDIEGAVCAVNHKTGDKVIGNFIPKSGSQESKIECKTYDSKGKAIWEILGSWKTQISIKHIGTGFTEQIWKEYPLLPDANM